METLSRLWDGQLFRRIVVVATMDARQMSVY